MRRFLPRCWPGTCLLAALLTCGCQHIRPRCSPCGSPCAALGAPVAANASPSPALDVPAASAAAAAPPVVQTALKADNAPAVDPMLSLAPPPRSSAPAALPATAQPTPLSFPGAAKFAHDPNYHWLVGTLDYSRIQEAWVLRYVPVEESDRYGGCVTLVPSGQTMNFKCGQTVLVEGALIDPNSQQLRPAFQVEDIRAEQP